MVVSTPDGPFTLPQQWREFLGPDVLSYRITIAARLRIWLSLYPKSSISHYLAAMRKDPGFVEWYSKVSQHSISNANLDKAAAVAKRRATIQAKYCGSPMSVQGIREKMISSSKARKRTYLVEGKEIHIPRDWKEFLGLDVLEYRITFKQRCYFLSTSPQGIRKILNEEAEFREWYDPKKQEKLAQSFTDWGKRDEKSKQTLQQSYGVSNPMQVPEFRHKLRQSREVTYIESYGRSFNSTIKERLLFEDIFPFYFPEDFVSDRQHSGVCLRCGHVFTYHFLSTGFPSCCPFCSGHSTKYERALTDFIAQYFPEVKKSTLHNHSSLDIYIPSKEVAFEINGAYSHNSGRGIGDDPPKDSLYHSNKTTQALSQGIKLYHIWEDFTNFELAKSIMLAKLGRSLTKVYARSLAIAELSRADAQRFYCRCHVKGFADAQRHFALLNGSGPLLCMSFTMKGSTATLVRNATSLNTQVIGGFTRLLHHSINILNPKVIYSFCDRDLTPDPHDSVYTRHHFIPEVGHPTLSYWAYKSSGVFKRNELINRMRLQKHLLPKLFPQTYDPNLTEQQNLALVGIYPIYNSGNFKYTLNL